MKGRPWVFFSLRAEPETSHPDPWPPPPVRWISPSLPAELVFDLAAAVVVQPAVVVAVDLVVPEPAVVVAVDLVVPEPQAVVAADLEAAERGVVFVPVQSLAWISGPRASVDIAVAFAALVPASVVAAEADSPGHPRFFAFPNIGPHSSSSSSVELVG